MTEMTELRPRLGGTDGVRGPATDEVGPGLMNTETVAGLTYALASLQQEQGAEPLCVIGRDTRRSGPALAEAAIAGALSAGAKVYDMGAAPTPAVLKTAQSEGAGMAVVLTASHNEEPDNGWKGTYWSDKPVGQQVDAISNRFWDQVDSGLMVPTSSEGAIERPDLLKAYMANVVANIEEEFGPQPLKGKIILVDGANGAAMKVTPSIMRQLGATVEEFACDGSGPINDGCGATNLNGVKNYLRARPELATHPDFLGAVANDGDADRMMGVGVSILPDGELQFDDLEGNRVMELQAQGQPGIVGTEYTNDAMTARLRAKGIGFELCPNGDTYVTAALRSKQAQGQNWTRGGEFTGHHVDLKWLSSGDGVRMAAWVAAYAAKNGTNFGELCQSMPLWPEEMVKIRLPENAVKTVLDHPEVNQAIAEAPALIGGRVIIRPSGTEQGVMRAWGVGPEKQRVATVVNGIADLIRRHAIEA